MSETLPVLHPDAAADLKQSGLNEETIARCGLHSVRPADLKACPISGVVHALAFPFLRARRQPLGISAAWHQKWAKRQRDSGDQSLTKELADEILQSDRFAKERRD